MKSQLTMADVKQQMLDLLDEIETLESSFVMEPQHIEHVHDLRVTLRRTRSLLSLIKPLVSKSHYKDIQSRLRQIASHFSLTRELDVLNLEVSHFQENNTELSEMIQKRRGNEITTLLEYVESETMRAQINKAIYLIHNIEENHLNFEDDIINRYKKWEKNLQEELKSLSSQDSQQIHETRIRLKKVRYVATYIKTLNEISSFNLEELKTIQDFLGDITDTYVHIKLLKQFNQETHPLIEHLVNKRKQLNLSLDNYINTRSQPHD